MKRFSFALALLALAVPGHAAIIDFTDSAVWSAAHNAASLTRLVDGIYVKVSGSGDLSATTFDGNMTDCATVLECHTSANALDGLGIVPPDDEVTYGGEFLDVTFWSDMDATVPLNLVVERILFLDLFHGVDGATDPHTEVAQWTYIGGLGGGSLGGVLTNAHGTGFAQTGPLGVAAHGLHFYANAGVSPANTDFAVAGIEVSPEPVPEPATMTLLGLGLLGIVSRRRRR